MGDFIIGAIKFIFFLVILPVVIFSVTNFFELLSGYWAGSGDFFLWGFVFFIFVYLFLFQFWTMYEYGQKIVRFLFGFLAPTNLLISRFIPLYLTGIYIGYFVVDKVLGIGTYDHYFVFFAGFFLALHIVSTAQDLQDQEKLPIKPSYWLTMEMVIIFNICLGVLVFDFIDGKFTFPRFLASVLDDSKGIYTNLFNLMM